MFNIKHHCILCHCISNIKFICLGYFIKVYCENVLNVSVSMCICYYLFFLTFVSRHLIINELRWQKGCQALPCLFPPLEVVKPLTREARVLHLCLPLGLFLPWTCFSHSFQRAHNKGGISGSSLCDGLLTFAWTRLSKKTGLTASHIRVKIPGSLSSLSIIVRDLSVFQRTGTRTMTLDHLALEKIKEFFPNFKIRLN